MYNFFRKYLSAFQFWRYMITLPLYYMNTLLPAVGMYCGVWIAEHALSFYKVVGLIILMVLLYFILGKAAIYHQKVLYRSIYHAGENLKIDLMEVMMKNRELSVDSSVLLNDVERIEENLFLGGIELIEQAVFYLLVFGIICYLNIWVAIALLILSTLVAAINTKSRKKGMFYQSQNSKQQKEQLTFLEQTEQGYETILMYQQQDRMQKQFENYADTLCATQGQLRWNQEKVQIISMTFLLSSLPVCVLGGNYLILAGALSLAQLMVIANLSNSMFKPIQKIMAAWFQVQSVQKTVEKLSDLLKSIDSAESLEKQAIPLIFYDKKDDKKDEEKDDRKNKKKMQMNHKLELHLESFSIHQKEVLQAIDFSIEKGEKVLLLGSNGCGKTTLLKYLLGYYGYQEGSLLIDGKDCYSLPWDRIATVFASVEQNFFLLSGSVKENISCFRELPFSTMQEVTSLCNLEEIIDREDALKLSGGQMQRIAIARAAASQRSIMVLDEAFSAVDKEHHFGIERELLQMPDLTLIEVVHQIAEENYLLFDKVILMNQGRIIQIGTPQELLQESFVRNLWERNEGEE